MHDNGKARSEQEVEVAGEHPKTFVSQNISHNSSSQTEKDSESPSMSGSRSEQTQSATVVPLALSSTLNSTGFDWSSLKNDDEWTPEGEFEMSFTLTIKGFGHFEREERNIATKLMRVLHQQIGDDRFQLHDEGGRVVVWDRDHPERPVAFFDPGTKKLL